MAAHTTVKSKPGSMMSPSGLRFDHGRSGSNAGSPQRYLWRSCFMSLRRRSHQTKQADDACSEHHEVDDDEGQQRRRHRRCRNRRMRIRSQQKSVYREGLPADYRRYPACDDSYESRRSQNERHSMKPAPVEQTAAQPGSQSAQAEAEHRKTETNHDAEGPEYDGTGRPYVAGEILQTGERRIRIMSKNQRTDFRDLNLVVDFRVGVARQAEQNERRAVRAALEVSFHRQDFRRLIFESIQSLSVAREDLKRGDECDHPGSHGKGLPRSEIIPIFQQVPRIDSAHHERGR